jgi:hypothetical protein
MRHEDEPAVELLASTDTSGAELKRHLAERFEPPRDASYRPEIQGGWGTLQELFRIKQGWTYTAPSTRSARGEEKRAGRDAHIRQKLRLRWEEAERRAEEEERAKGLRAPLERNGDEEREKVERRTAEARTRTGERERAYARRTRWHESGTYT